MARNLIKQLAWKDWFYGMWVALATGSATAGYAAIVAMTVDSHDFAFGSEKFLKLFIAMELPAIKDFLLYISNNPAPKIIETEQSELRDKAGDVVATATTVRTTTSETEEKPKNES